MNHLVKSCLGVMACGVLSIFSGCSDDDAATELAVAGASSSGGTDAGQGGQGQSDGRAGSPSVDGAAQCRVIGELCHESDTGEGAAHDCHELGHEADEASCRAGFAGCVEVCVEDSAGEEPLCAALGELCHAVDDKTGPLHECHELGHVNDRATCAAAFDACAERCLAARELLESGAGGVSSGGAAGSAGASADSGGGGAGGAR